MIEATVQAVRDGATRYTAVTGEVTLRKAICEDLERRKGVKYAPEEIIVGNGAKQEVYQAVLALCRYVFGFVLFFLIDFFLLVIHAWLLSERCESLVFGLPGVRAFHNNKDSTPKTQTLRSSTTQK